MIVTHDDLHKLRGWARKLVVRPADVDDLVQTAISQMIANDEEFDLNRCWGYMKNISRRERTQYARHPTIDTEPTTITLMAETHHEQFDTGELSLVPHSRHKPNQLRVHARKVGFGKGKKLPYSNCEVCDGKFKAKLSHGKRIRSCGKAECRSVLIGRDNRARSQHGTEV